MVRLYSTAVGELSDMTFYFYVKSFCEYFQPSFVMIIFLMIGSVVVQIFYKLHAVVKQTQQKAVFRAAILFTVIYHGFFVFVCFLYFLVYLDGIPRRTREMVMKTITRFA